MGDSVEALAAQLVAATKEATDKNSTPTTSVAEKVVPPGAVDDVMSAVGEIASMDAKDKGVVDEHPDDGKPQGRYDILLLRAFEERKDLRGRSYRLFDDIKDPHAQTFIAQQAVKRFKEKDRRTNTRDVQLAIDILREVGIHWHETPFGMQGSNVRIILPDGSFPHA